MNSIFLSKRVIFVVNFFLLFFPLIITKFFRLEQFFESWTWDLFILFGLCFLLYFGLIIADYLSDKIKIFTNKNRNKLCFLLFFTLLITGYQHVKNSTHVLSIIICQDLRTSVSKKIEKAMYDGTSGSKLTTDEYRYLKFYLDSSLPDVPETADSISYYQSFDFVMYYNIRVSFVVPVDTEIDTFDFKGSNYYHGQSVEIKNGLKYVEYINHKY